LATLLAVGGGIAATLAAEGGAAEFDQGARLAAICASCHDADGENHGIPPLTGLDEKQITEALARYRASEAPSIVMHAIALSLSEDDVKSVVRYLAGRGKEARP
jgi:cytochrome c553